MKDHPLTPMRDSSLLRLLEPQVTAPVGLIGWPTVARGAEAIADALADLEMRGIAHVAIALGAQLPKHRTQSAQ